ncbi:MAG TPA: hypothetical protein VJ750_00595 [Rhizomicrobium sp.]|nr:hypothetical protein [Rhizomicrobium sp.]
MNRWQQIGKRDWGQIREIWANHVPPIPRRAAAPTILSEKIIGDGLAAQSLVFDALNVCPDSLREAILWEAVFLLHKGGHAICSAQDTLNSGRVSWSQFNAYHGAFLVGRAVLAFLGVCTPRPGGQYFLLDAFPPPAKIKKGKAPIAPQIHLWRAKQQIEQRQFWELLIRTIRMTDGAPWNVDIADSLLNVNPELFSKRRNPFLYSVPFWPFADLIQPSAQMNILTKDADFPAGLLDDTSPQFLWVTALFTFQLGLQLLKDLASGIPLLDQELLAFRNGYWPTANGNYELFFGPV